MGFETTLRAGSRSVDREARGIGVNQEVNVAGVNLPTLSRRMNWRHKSPRHMTARGATRYSARKPTSFAMRAHTTPSSRMRRANSSGVPPAASSPEAASLRLTSGSASAF